MGKKRLLITSLLGSSLLFAAGFTAFKGINSGINKVEATDDYVTVYLDISEPVTRSDDSDPLYWDSDGALVNMCYWGGSSSAGDDGVTMTKVMTGIYTLDVPSDTQFIEFVRADPNTGKAWNRSLSGGAYLSTFTTDITTNNIYKLLHYDMYFGSNAGYWNGLADIVEDGYYVVGDQTFLDSIGHSGTEWHYDSGKVMTTLSGGGDKAKILGLNLLEGSTFKAKSLHDKQIFWHESNIINNTTGVSIVDGNYYINTTGRYNLFINEYNQAWLGNANGDATTAAVNYATTFNSSMKAACEDEDKTASSLASAWGNQNDAFDLLSEETKGILANASKDDTTYTELATFAGKYDFIYGKYGYTNNWVDFASRAPDRLANSNRISFFIEGDNTPFILVSVLSILSISGIATYLFLRKRRLEK